MERTMNQSSNVDAAALAAATLAGVLSAIVPSGPYSFVSGIAAITLMTILLAYERNRVRSRSQSCALACALALAALPLVGLIFEIVWATDFHSFLYPAPDDDTRVGQGALAIAWILLTPAAYALDRMAWQPKPPKPAA
jgi:hypothetical protein